MAKYLHDSVTHEPRLVLTEEDEQAWLGAWDVCECEHAREDHDGNCNALTMSRRAKCSCPSFKLARTN